MKKKAFITGITGQDGAYLADLLLKKGYEVHGLKRRSSLFNTQRIDHLFQKIQDDNRKLFLHYGDLTDSASLTSILQKIKPDEVYNLAAMSHVKVSFEVPEYVADVDGLGALRLLEVIKNLGLNNTKIYQASTSELYGKVKEIPQNENTPFNPRSPYAISKLFAYHITKNYREAYGIFASNGILFNHESPIRGETFVTRKITRGLSRIFLGEENVLYLGNLNSKRDWGHAKDYVEAMWKILQHDIADDWVIATGKTTSVRDFIVLCCDFLNIKIKFQGEGLNEVGLIVSPGKSKKLKKGDIIVKVDKNYYRPTEVDFLLGDSSKAKKILNWKPKYDLKDLVDEMMFSDLQECKKNILLRDNGYEIIKSYYENE